MGAGTESHHQFHVLAVDDSLIDRKLIEQLLKTSSYQVTTVDSGSKALEFLGFHEDDDQSSSASPSVSPTNHREVEVNLIITDYCMPGMTGFDLLKKLKESSSLRDIPVVIMSSENVPSRITRCLEEGAEEFFLKPVRLSDVKKLRPHMMRTRQIGRRQNKMDTREKDDREEGKEESVSHRPEIQSQEPPTPQHKQGELGTEHHQPQQLQQPSGSNKRKTIEEELSPDRTRRRYNGVTALV